MTENFTLIKGVELVRKVTFSYGKYPELGTSEIDFQHQFKNRFSTQTLHEFSNYLLYNVIAYCIVQ